MRETPIQADWTPERIKALRLSLGLTQDQFAARLHLARPTVARWETGKFRPNRHMTWVLDQLESQVAAAI